MALPGERPRDFVPALLDAADAAHDLLEGGIGGYPATTGSPAPGRR